MKAKAVCSGDFPIVQWLRLCFQRRGLGFGSRVRELRCYMPHNMAKKKNQNNILCSVVGWTSSDGRWDHRGRSSEVQASSLAQLLRVGPACFFLEWLRLLDLVPWSADSLSCQLDVVVLKWLGGRQQGKSESGSRWASHSLCRYTGHHTRLDAVTILKALLCESRLLPLQEFDQPVAKHNHQ